MYRGVEMQSKSVSSSGKWCRPPRVPRAEAETLGETGFFSVAHGHILSNSHFTFFFLIQVFLYVFCSIHVACNFFSEIIFLCIIFGAYKLKNIFISFKIFSISTSVISSFSSSPCISCPFLAWFTLVLKYTNNSLKFGLIRKRLPLVH